MTNTRYALMSRKDKIKGMIGCIFMVIFIAVMLLFGILKIISYILFPSVIYFDYGFCFFQIYICVLFIGFVICLLSKFKNKLFPKFDKVLTKWIAYSFIAILGFDIIFSMCYLHLLTDKGYIKCSHVDGANNHRRIMKVAIDENSCRLKHSTFDLKKYFP
ncbi:hypothetical protein [Rahnella laticis]|uniref:hypothetical protein n=1 Tax=Rahnella laticis TaxID=2787622 RepID=UPI0018A31BA1|nr:hypothetical protein [Rahnella laticis]MBF7995443.1 hypothetical protein [Rahnella laticis]